MNHVVEETVYPDIEYPVNVPIEVEQRNEKREETPVDFYTKLQDKDELSATLKEIIARSIQALPEESRARKQIIELLTENPWQIRQIPEEFITRDVFMEACKQRPECLEHAPDKFREKDFFMAALDQDVSCFQYIPPAFMDEKMCEKVTSSLNWFPPESISHLPDHKACYHFLERMDINRVKFFIPHLAHQAVTRPLMEMITKRDITTVFDFMERGDRIPADIYRNFLNYPKMDAKRFIKTGEISPEMCLAAVKTGNLKPENVPPKIREGDNIYNFALRTEKALSTQLSVEQIEKLYTGTAILIPISLDGDRELYRRLEWNKEKNIIEDRTLSSIVQKTSLKERWDVTKAKIPSFGLAEKFKQIIGNKNDTNKMRSSQHRM